MEVNNTPLAFDGNSTLAHQMLQEFGRPLAEIIDAKSAIDNGTAQVADLDRMLGNVFALVSCADAFTKFLRMGAFNVKVYEEKEKE